MCVKMSVYVAWFFRPARPPGSGTMGSISDHLFERSVRGWPVDALVCVRPASASL